MGHSNPKEYVDGRLLKSMELDIGQRFSTADEADKYIQDYARVGCHPIRRCNMVTVQSYNKKVSVSLMVY